MVPTMGSMIRTVPYWVGNALRILVIDDDANSLLLADYLLRARNHDVITATDATSGYREVRRKPFDVVLTDIQLPDINGYDFLKRCRALWAMGSTQFVALTALAMRGEREKALGNGFDGYISKPIEPFDFAATVEAIAHRFR